MRLNYWLLILIAYISFIVGAITGDSEHIMILHDLNTVLVMFAFPGFVGYMAGRFDRKDSNV